MSEQVLCIYIYMGSFKTSLMFLKKNLLGQFIYFSWKFVIIRFDLKLTVNKL
jgi:hypothetical protein